MKKILILALVMVSSINFAQSIEPQLEILGNLVKATYFYENGTIQQVGYFKDGKLDGKWTSYDNNGFLKVSATYSEGNKVGTWIYYNNSLLAKQIDYSNNEIVAIRDSKLNDVVSKN
jgi:antitoxin component YwqK of YwqJK toxin-antitoxin module